MSKLTRVTVDLPEQFHRIVKSLAAARGESIRKFIMNALNEYIEDQKDMQAGLIALAEYNSNPENAASINLEELADKNESSN